MKGTSCCAISYKEKLELSDRACYGKFLSHCLHDFRCLYLRVASSSLTTLAIISYNLPCHVLVHSFGPFLSQDMFFSLQVFAFERQNMTFIVYVLLTCIQNCDAGLVSDKNCLQVKYSG